MIATIDLNIGDTRRIAEVKRFLNESQTTCYFKCALLLIMMMMMAAACRRFECQT